MKREHDSRLRQLDRLDRDVKSAAESVKAWKSRAQIKQGEVDTCKVSPVDCRLEKSPLNVVIIGNHFRFAGSDCIMANESEGRRH